MTAVQILENLKQQGSRITKVRSLVIGIFQPGSAPFSEPEIRAKLAKLGRTVNKTTVYRELEYLKTRKIIKAVDFGDGKKRYELNGGHHHHLICTKCKKVDEIVADNDISELEQKIKKNKKFKVTSHSLEFFGTCFECTKSN